MTAGTPMHQVGVVTGQSRSAYLFGTMMVIVLMLLSGLLVYLLLATLVSGGRDLPYLQSYGLLAINALAIPALALVTRWMHGMSLRDLIAPARPLAWGMAGRAALVYAVPLIVQVIIGFWSGELQPSATPLAVFLLLAPISVAMFTLQASAEELLFRGYLAQGAQLLFRHALPAALLTGVLFTLAHEGSGVRAVWAQRAEIMVMALFLSWMTVRFGRLEAAMGVHIINNVLFSFFVGGVDLAFPDLLTRVDPDPPDFAGFADLMAFALHQVLTIGFFWLVGVKTGFIERGWASGGRAPRQA
ncbi:hypothetical protein CHU95_02865 [Niveispirillum lacus]|uniref:CAAX prenyl protease 2/Lysostaphin resistance protein A-like domain-containing protein n=1 Tax=Niveispirillum lacus TaxID=1981099 RepID=A0A255Z7U4_9PROT|nr:CPBP family intramembrane glutamic endopeptidase [Niveispirillum lacus]OYQ36945.1 hypothetical protein CHU95_02865 [Niveispirillum lacus]